MLSLRQWRNDPTTPLDHLPLLGEESFSTATFVRLLSHLKNALDEVGHKWQESLSDQLSRVKSHQELERLLIQTRALLARRVQLAKHPGLPPKVREMLTTEIERAVFRYDEEFEEQVRSILTLGTGVSGATRENWIRTVRENRFAQVLTFEISQDGSRHAATPLDSPSPVVARDSPDPSSSTPQPVQGRGRHRAIFISGKATVEDM